jgi:DNA-binding NtrC family response regulator
LTEAERILIVDDDDGLCRALSNLLNSEGYVTEYVHTGREAVQLMARTEYDLILLDNRLPDVEGLDLLPRIRLSDTTTPIVIFTGHASIESAAVAMKRGATSCWEKSLGIQEILPRINLIMNNTD